MTHSHCGPRLPVGAVSAAVLAMLGVGCDDDRVLGGEADGEGGTKLRRLAGGRARQPDLHTASFDGHGANVTLPEDRGNRTGDDVGAAARRHDREIVRTDTQKTVV